MKELISAALRHEDSREREVIEIKVPDVGV